MDLLVHLETFVAVAEAMSFSQAADELGIAQPLLSRRIRSLEEYLGGELFDRGKRQIRITELGTLLLPYAKDLLGRSNHLLTVVRGALTSAPISLAVPPDCDPRSLAGAIRVAAERGLVLQIRELAADQRAEALTNGSVTLALVRVPADTAAIRVRLGLASATALAPPSGSVHLDALRTRRGAPTKELPILVTAEDDVPAALRRAAARAGLAENRIRSASSTAAALADTLAGNCVLLCSEQFARRHQVAWGPLADESIARGYDLAGKERADWLLPLVAAAVGARSAPGKDAALRMATSG